jgi:hypothetical protein
MPALQAQMAAHAFNAMLENTRKKQGMRPALTAKLQNTR